jgi:hypothetical protein
MAEFQYNNHIHSSTQQIPFFLDSGQHPRMGFEPQQPSRLESVNEFTDRMKLALEEAKSALAKAKDDMARYYNQRRLPTPVYKPGDLVYLDASDIKTTRPSWKLSHRRLGPFPIERQVSRNAYRLQLPFPMRRLYPVFNIVKLTTAPVRGLPVPLFGPNLRFVASARHPLASAIFGYRSSSAGSSVTGPVITLFSIIIYLAFPLLIITRYSYPCILMVDTCL